MRRRGRVRSRRRRRCPSKNRRSLRVRERFAAQVCRGARRRARPPRRRIRRRCAILRACVRCRKYRQESAHAVREFFRAGTRREFREHRWTAFPRGRTPRARLRFPRERKVVATNPPRKKVRRWRARLRARARHRRERSRRRKIRKSREPFRRRARECVLRKTEA